MIRLSLKTRAAHSQLLDASSSTQLRTLPASSAVLDIPSNSLENKSAFAASQICVLTPWWSSSCRGWTEFSSTWIFCFWISAVNSYRTESMTKMQIWGSKSLHCCFTKTQWERKCGKLFSVTFYRQNCFFFLSSKKCFVLFTNVLVFYLQEMKTTLQSVKRDLGKPRSLHLETVLFPVIKTAEEFKKLFTQL